MERSTAPGETGYTLVAIVMFICVLMILIMAVGPAVSKIMQRENEEELIFRGKQYANAILVFQRKQGRLPLKLEELTKTRPWSIRRLFKEPMCNCADWGVIHVGEPWPHPPPGGLSGATGPLGQPGVGGELPGIGPGQPSTNSGLPGTYSQPPGGQFNNSPPSRSPTGAIGFSDFPTDSSLPQNGDPYANRPIIGVYSKVHKKGIRTYKGREFYDDWGFIAGQNNDDLFPLQTIPGGSGLRDSVPSLSAPPPQNPPPNQPN